jgi:cyclomaltodextrinase
MAILPYIGRLDGCLDFHVGEAIRKTFAYRTWTEADFERFLQRHEEYFGREGDFIQPTFIDNHDMDRFLYAAGGDKDALRRAAAAQMRLPGPPIIYYGTEVGLSQRKSKGGGLGLEASREPMAWGGAQDRDLLAYYQSLIRQRRETQS